MLGLSLALARLGKSHCTPLMCSASDGFTNPDYPDQSAPRCPAASQPVSSQQGLRNQGNREHEILDGHLVFTPSSRPCTSSNSEATGTVAARCARRALPPSLLGQVGMQRSDSSPQLRERSEPSRPAGVTFA